MWAHAEYIRLLRSVSDGSAFGFSPDVAARYLAPNRHHKSLEIWKPNRQPRSVRAGWILRIQAREPFRLVWTEDEWQTQRVSLSVQTNLGISFADVYVLISQKASIRFTLFWTDSERWEGRDYEVAVDPPREIDGVRL
jgi:glucoamylase